jgi:probable phosphoglycerate mutase
MTLFYLIRHGNTDMVNRTLAGRLPGVHLNAEGEAQAIRLADRLSEVPFEAIYTSPLERTRETAAPLATRLGIEIRISESFNEIDYGAWTGISFADIQENPDWRKYNLFRSGTRIPEGDLMPDVQRRTVRELERLRELFPKGAVAIVAHGDVIKLAIAYFAGIPIDFILRLTISPASVSVVSVEDYGPRIVCVNDTGEPGRL